MSTFSTDRRGFLQYSSIVSASLLVAPAEAATPLTDFCQAVPEHPSVLEGDNEYQTAKNALWQEFIDGTRASGDSPAIANAAEQHILSKHGAILRRKVRFWSLCESETRNCCFSAGIIANLARKAAGEQNIEVAHFEAAALAVKQIQHRRTGKAQPGIAC